MESNTTKYLLFTGIIAFSLWIASEMIEICNGYTPVVYYLTAGYHFLAGFGILGLHKAQSKDKNLLSMIGAIVGFLAYLSLTFFPIQVMNSGLSFSAFIETNPIYKIPGGVWFLGMMLFGISVLRSQFYPKWTAIVFLSGILMFTATPLLQWPTLPVNITNIVLALTIIYMSFLGLKSLKKDPKTSKQV